MKKKQQKNNTGVDVALLKTDWEKKVKDIFDEATVTVPLQAPANTSGKEGKHTEHLDEILKDMQYLQRAYPGCTW